MEERTLSSANKIESEVNDFIKRRFQLDCNWVSGNCFYFAIILKERFCEYDPELYYDVIDGHFLCKIRDSFYDWTGKRTYDSLNHIKKWSAFHNEDELWFNRIVRDVIL